MNIYISNISILHFFHFSVCVYLYVLYINREIIKSVNDFSLFHKPIYDISIIL